MASSSGQSGGAGALRRLAGGGLVLFLTLVSGGWVDAQGRHAKTAPPSSVATAMGPMTQTPIQRLTAALGQIGMTACAPAVERAGRFLFEDGDAAFTVQPLGPNADRWPTVVVAESAHASSGTTRLTTLSVSPGADCSGFYEQVIYWPIPCDGLKKTVFTAFQSPHPLLRSVQVSELNAGLQLYLLPAGAGCTSVKKELFH